MISVTLNDTGIPYEQAYSYFKEADLWAQHHCKSYEGYEAVDVSDVSYVNDVVANYKFGDKQDVTLFRLRWS